MWGVFLKACVTYSGWWWEERKKGGLGDRQTSWPGPRAALEQRSHPPRPGQARPAARPHLPPPASLPRPVAGEWVNDREQMDVALQRRSCHPCSSPTASSDRHLHLPRSSLQDPQEGRELGCESSGSGPGLTGVAPAPSLSWVTSSASFSAQCSRLQNGVMWPLRHWVVRIKRDTCQTISKGPGPQVPPKW